MKKLLTFLFLLIGSTSFATHNMAGDITYRYIGDVSFPYRYEITVKTYTKWIGPSGTDKCELNVHFGDGDTAIAPRVNGPSMNCSSPNTDGILIGGCTGNIRMNVYITTHDYDGPGDYYISMEDPNRSSGICNVMDSDNTSFYIQARLIINPFLGNNSGPVFNSVPVICPMISVTNYYNPSAIDADGDSLFYELIPPMGNGVSIPLYTYPTASTFFWIAYDTGTVTWDAPTMLCFYVFDLQITEYRNIGGNYYMIGKTMQEVHATTTPYNDIYENENQVTPVNVFPNPSNGLINLTIESALQNQEFQIVISNSLGQIIKTLIINNNSAVINENELSAGIYFYSLLNKTEVVNKGKFVILDGIMK